jgi:hypothetical protein
VIDERQSRHHHNKSNIPTVETGKKAFLVLRPDGITSQSCDDTPAQLEKHHTNRPSAMARLPSIKQLTVLLISAVLLISYQKPTAVQHFKSTSLIIMSVTSKIVNSAITAIGDEATTTRNKWLTLEAWKTILYHYYDLDDQLGFNINLLTKAVRLFGSSVDSKVSLGNETGVHLRTQYLVKKVGESGTV